MQPEDIEGREFFVGLRGYDRDELDAEREKPVEEVDPFEHLGANVTSILRTANESAAGITQQAHEEAESILDAARSRAAEIVAAAEARVPFIEDAAEEAGRRRAAALVDAEVARLAAAAAKHAALRDRLVEASEELQLAVLAIGDPTDDADAAVQDAVRGVVVLD